MEPCNWHAIFPKANNFVIQNIQKQSQVTLQRVEMGLNINTIKTTGYSLILLVMSIMVIMMVSKENLKLNTGSKSLWRQSTAHIPHMMKRQLHTKLTTPGTTQKRTQQLTQRLQGQNYCNKCTHNQPSYSTERSHLPEQKTRLFAPNASPEGEGFRLQSRTKLCLGIFLKV